MANTFEPGSLNQLANDPDAYIRGLSRPGVAAPPQSRFAAGSLNQLANDPDSFIRDMEQQQRAQREEAERQQREAERAARGPATGDLLGTALTAERSRRANRNYLTSSDFAGDVVERLPFVGAVKKTYDLLSVRSAALRLGEDKAQKGDYETVARFLVDSEEDEKRGVIAQIWNIVSEIPAFAIEFGLTGGAFSGAAKATTTGLARVVAPAVARRAVGRAVSTTARRAVAYGVGTAAQTAAMPQRVAEEAARRALPGIAPGPEGSLSVTDPGGFASQLPAAFASTAIEAGSERTGAALPWLGRQMARLPGVGPGLQAIGQRWVNSAPGRSIAAWESGVGALARRFGNTAYNGVAGELFEERVSEVANGLFGLTNDYGLTGDVFAGRLGKAGERLLVEAVAMSAVPFAYAAASRSLQKKGLKPEVVEDRLQDVVELVNDLRKTTPGISQEDITKAIDARFKDRDLREFGRTLANTIGERNRMLQESFDQPLEQGQVRRPPTSPYPDAPEGSQPGLLSMPDAPSRPNDALTIERNRVLNAPYNTERYATQPIRATDGPALNVGQPEVRQTAPVPEVPSSGQIAPEPAPVAQTVAKTATPEPVAPVAEPMMAAARKTKPTFTEILWDFMKESDAAHANGEQLPAEKVAKIREAIKKAGKLTDRMEEVLFERLNNRTFQEIADADGVRKQGVQEAFKKALDKLEVDPVIQERMMDDTRAEQKGLLMEKSLPKSQAGEVSVGYMPKEEAPPRESADPAYQQSNLTRDQLTEAWMNERDPKKQAKIAQQIQEAERAAKEGGVYFAPPGPGSPSPVPGPGSTRPINEMEFRRTALDLFGEAGYVGKVPAAQAAAYLTYAKQLVQSGMAIGDSPILIHEIAHGVSFKNKLNMASAPQDVKIGLSQFDYNRARGPSAVGLQEGFAEWMRLRVTGQLAGKQLTPQQQAAAQWAESKVAQAGLAQKMDRLTALYQDMANRTITQRAQGMASPSGQPAQATGLTPMEGMAQRVETVGSGAQRLLENRLAPADQLTAEREKIGMGALPPGQSLSATLEVTQHLPEQWASRMADKGIIALEKDANGNRHEVVISASPRTIVEGIAPELLQAKGASMIDAAKKFVGLPVHEESSWLGTFILAKNVTEKVARGTQQMQSLKKSEVAEGKRNVAAASTAQIEAFKKFLDDVRLNDPALYQKASGAYDKYTAITDALLEARVIDGTMTRKLADTWRANEPNHVSLARVMEEGGYKVEIGKERRGSGRQFVDPLRTLEDRIAIRAQEMATRLKDEAIIREGTHGQGPAGVSNFFREITDPKVKDSFHIDIDSRLEAMGYSPAMRQAIISMIGTEFHLAKPWNDGNRNVYTAIVDGERRVLEFNSKSLYDLVAGNTGMQSDSQLVSAVAKLVNLPGARHIVDVLKFSATTANTVFPIRNMLRDPWAYAQNVMGGKRSFLEDVMNFLKGHQAAFAEKGRKLGGFDYKNEIFRAYDEGGGEALRGPYSYAPGGKGNEAWRVVRGEAGTLKDKTVRIIEKMKDFLEMFGAGEHGPRFAEYRNALIEMGYSEAQIKAARQAEPHKNPIALTDDIAARQRAARATVQFSRQGELTHELNKVVPFLTPAIAGLSQESRNWKAAFIEMKAGKFGPRAKAMIGTLGVYLGAELLHHFMVKDEEWYTELPAHLRYNWWILGQRENGGVWGIPKPQGILRMIGAYAQESLRAGSDKAPDFGMATRNVAFEQATPRLLPIGIGEGLAVASNRSWSGRPIVPAQSQREDTNFDQWIKYKIPYLAEQLTGGLISTRALRAPWEAFTSSQGVPNQSVETYYQTLHDLTAERTRVRRQGGVYEREREYDALHRAEEEMQRLASEARGDRRQGNRTIQGEPPSEARLRDIRQLQLNLARQALARARQ